MPEGKAIEAAQELAREIAELPQDCLRNDRASMYDTWGNPMPRRSPWNGSTENVRSPPMPATVPPVLPTVPVDMGRNARIVKDF